METSKRRSKLMRKNKKRHNEKAREITDVMIDTREQKRIVVENGGTAITYDECNALVLPSTKRKTKKLKITKPKPLLSKKRKKMLEKVMEKKRKKANRATLLEDLAKIQASSAHLDCLTSLQAHQTLGRKKVMQQLSETPAEMIQTLATEKPRANLLKGFNKRCRQDNPKANKRMRQSYRTDIVQTSSEEESDLSDDDSKMNDATKILKPESTQSVCETITIENDAEVHVVETKQEATPVLCVEEESDQLKKLDSESMPAVFKILNRTPEIKEYRSKLPVVSMEYEIMTAIKENPIVIVDGSTGSGKTTQVPQFLYEAGFTSGDKMIAVTEPRRVAAIEMSKRVAFEMNLSSDEVSYQIRFEGNATERTKLKFLTDGVLLKEFLRNPLLENYSAIIIDEAHERSVFSDILIGILSRVVIVREKKKNPLKIIIMSATMDGSSFTNNPKLFAVPPPVVKVDSKMFDVVVHYNKVTYYDYIDQAFRKVCKIHRQLPAGGILIFVTGKDEVHKLCQKLRLTFPKSKTPNADKLCGYEEKRAGKRKRQNSTTDKQDDSLHLPKISLSDFSEANLQLEEKSSKIVETSGELEDDDDEISDEQKTRLLGERNGERFSEQPLHILPMFSMLSSDKLSLVFKDPPSGTRLCVVATNIAETSLTIPNIVYVIDTGKIKGKVYNSNTGVSRMEVMWTSKASADQRKGRAGRVQNGHCYRLYSATVFTEQFANHAPADILRRPVDDVVLAMKSRKIPVLTFPYITPPPKVELQRSISRLKMLGALEDTDLSMITSFGKKMSQLSIAPRFSKILLESFVYSELTPHFVLLVCGLTVQEPFLTTGYYSDCRNAWLGDVDMSRYLGDLMILMAGIWRAEESPNDKKFCEDNGIRFKAYQEIRKLRRQVTNEANLVFPDLNLPIRPDSYKLTNPQANMMRKIILQGSLDRIAKKVRSYEMTDDSMSKLYYNAYRIASSNAPIYLHQSSPFRKELPSWVVYQEIYEVEGKKIMRGVSTFEYHWVEEFASKISIYFDSLPNTESLENIRKEFKQFLT